MPGTASVSKVVYTVEGVVTYDSVSKTLTANTAGDGKLIGTADGVIKTVNITITEPLTWIKELPTSVEYTEGDMIEFDVELIGGEEPYYYVWYDYMGVSDITTNVFSATANVEMDNYVLSVTAMDIGDRTLTSEVLIIVNAIEVP